MYDSVQVNFTTSDFSAEELETGRVFWLSDNVEVAQTQSDAVLFNTQNTSQGNWRGAFDVTANFIGYTEVKMVLEGDCKKWSTNIVVYFFLLNKKILGFMVYHSKIQPCALIFLAMNFMIP